MQRKARHWRLAAALSLAAAGCANSGPAVDSKRTPAPEQRVVPAESAATQSTQVEQEEAGSTASAMALAEGKLGKSNSPDTGSAAPMDQGSQRNEGMNPAPARSLPRVGAAKNSGVMYGGLGTGPGGGGTDIPHRTVSAGRYGASGHGTVVSASGYGIGYGRAGHGGSAPSMLAPPNTESYKSYGVNTMIETATDRLSTFAVDVDTASYAIARRKLGEGTLPPAAAIRVEEFLNYFHYDYPAPTDNAPFAVHLDAAPSPFTKGRHILRVGVQAKKLSQRERKPANLVFLVDVSGSMQSSDKLELAKRALRILVDNLRDGDTVALVTYAGSTRVVLEPMGLEHKSRIALAIEELSAGGSTAMGSGIQLAYELAARNLRDGAVSRVIVLSDGDANVGDTSHAQILETIRGHVAEGVTLSTVGFGMGNYQDELMEQLANKGNGNYYYIDGISQARRVFQEQLGGTLEVVAKDVKIQVDFEPEAVARYRLIGYENRDVADRDFRNDKVDAGEIGAGHRVTALYEIELKGQPSMPLATVRIRAKEPRGQEAREWAHGFDMSRLYASFEAAPEDLRFATAVVGLAEVLRKSEHARSWRLDQILAIAEQAGAQRSEERRELVDLVRALDQKKLLAKAAGRP